MDRFIVGTGRCGSTLLSRMLAENFEVLSIFEFFNGLDATKRFDAAPVTGGAFAALIAAEQPFVTAVLRRGYEVSEITYPFGRSSRFARGDPLPWILVSMLPRLGSDPDPLFDEVMSFCSELPEAPLARHYRALFDHLCTGFGRKLWIERSGSSIDYLAGLSSFFPEARFLHIHRDGPEAALSMREHHAYRLPIAILYGSAGAPEAATVAAALRAAPRPDDPISRILASRPPVEYYGRYWSDQMLRGEQARAGLAPDQYLAVRFEDLVGDPRRILGGICEFFAIDPAGDDWLDRAVALVHGVPPARFGELSAEERAILTAACRPGRECVGRAD
jgi:hypothetical protein